MRVVTQSRARLRVAAPGAAVRVADRRHAEIINPAGAGTRCVPDEGAGAGARRVPAVTGAKRDGSEEKTAGQVAARLLHTEGGTRRDGSEEKTAGQAGARLAAEDSRGARLAPPHDQMN